MRKKNSYGLINGNWTGYDDQMRVIGNWKDVLRWAKDGSIRPCDKVVKLVECRQPRLPENENT